MRKYKVYLTATLLVLTAALSGAQSVRAGDSTCLGQSSSGNPYWCYTNGNCTWWAWKMAKDNWGDPLLAPAKWGDAKNWAAGARNDGYTVSATPAAYTIAVNTTVYSALAGYATGHVAWVERFDGTYVYVSEMNYGTGKINYGKKYPKGWFQYYIYPKPRPRISSISPNPRFYSWGNLDYWVYGANFSYGERNRICWPSGGCTVLSGAQIPYSDPNQFKMRVTIAQTGMWSITAINGDGRESAPFYFYIW